MGDWAQELDSPNSHPESPLASSVALGKLLNLSVMISL